MSTIRMSNFKTFHNHYYSTEVDLYYNFKDSFFLYKLMYEWVFEQNNITTLVQCYIELYATRIFLYTPRDIEFLVDLKLALNSVVTNNKDLLYDLPRMLKETNEFEDYIVSLDKLFITPLNKSLLNLYKQSNYDIEYWKLLIDNLYDTELFTNYTFKHKEGGNISYDEVPHGIILLYNLIMQLLRGLTETTPFNTTTEEEWSDEIYTSYSDMLHGSYIPESMIISIMEDFKKTYKIINK